MNVRSIVRPASFVLVFGALALSGCSDWTAFRGDPQRTAYKDDAGAFSDASKVASMHQVWTFHPPAAQAFRASAIVLFSKVFIGNGNGYFYALDAQTGANIWQFPAVGAPALQWGFPNCGNRSGYGVASSATTGWSGTTPVVIFGAPDPSIGMGDGRLFMLKANDGTVIWKSPSLAQVTGTTNLAANEKHEHLGYSSPLVEGDRIYIGVSDTCDNPIQLGRVVAVDFATGNISAGFSFVNGPRPSSTYPPGGDVWGSVAADAHKLYVTTGNAKAYYDPSQPEPSPNYGLSLLQLDPTSGAPQWQHQPVPYSMDEDPDWSATPTVMHASCGNIVVGTMKDGWTWALNAGAGAGGGHPAVRWMFPTSPAWINGFHPGDGTSHGDTDYIRPGAAWGDIYVTMDGGEDTVDHIYSGFSHLHALDVCADDAHRIRWIATSPSGSFGFPVITKGLVYVGTDGGHLVVLADPSVSAPTSFICSKTTVTNAQCVANGFRLVPQPNVLVDKVLDGAVLTEPVLAEKNLYVATDNGTLYMFDP